MTDLDLDELLPEDLTITFRNEKYVIPGDLSVESAFRLVAYRNQLGRSDSVAAQRKTLGEIEQFMLELFQQRQPAMTKLPFGVFGLTKVITTYLEHIGLEVTGGESGDPADPDDENPPNRAARRASSTGSPRSPKSSAGSRKRGGASPSPS